MGTEVAASSLTSLLGSSYSQRRLRRGGEEGQSPEPSLPESEGSGASSAFLPPLPPLPSPPLLSPPIPPASHHSLSPLPTHCYHSRSRCTTAASSHCRLVHLSTPLFARLVLNLPPTATSTLDVPPPSSHRRLRSGSFRCTTSQLSFIDAAASPSLFLVLSSAW